MGNITFSGPAKLLSSHVFKKTRIHPFIRLRKAYSRSYTSE